MCIEHIEGFEALSQLVGLEERWILFEARDQVVELVWHNSIQLVVIVSHSSTKNAMSKAPVMGVHPGQSL